MAEQEIPNWFRDAFDLFCSGNREAARTRSTNEVVGKMEEFAKSFDREYSLKDAMEEDPEKTIRNAHNHCVLTTQQA